MKQAIEAMAVQVYLLTFESVHRPYFGDDEKHAVALARAQLFLCDALGEESNWFELSLEAENRARAELKHNKRDVD